MNTEHFYKQLESLMAQKDTKKTEQFLVSFLEQTREERDYAAYLAVGSEMIGFYRHICAFEKAFDSAEDILLLMEELQMENSEHFAAALINTAVTYRAAGIDKQAYSYYVQALRIYESLLEPGDERFAALYCDMSSLLEQMNENDYAITLLENALQILKPLKEKALEHAFAMTSLALLYLKTKRPMEAGGLFTQALTIFENYEGLADARYSAALAGAGETFFLLEDYENAMKAYEKAAQTVKKHFGEQESYGVLLQNLSVVCAKLNRTEAALAYSEKARKIQDRLANICSNVL